MSWDRLLYITSKIEFHYNLSDTTVIYSPISSTCSFDEWMAQNPLELMDEQENLSTPTTLIGASWKEDNMWRDITFYNELHGIFLFDNCYRTFWFIELELFHYYVFIVTFTRLILYRLNNATFKFRKGNIDTHANEHLWDYPKSGYLIYVIALYAVLKANILPTSFFLKYVKANIMFTSESS